MAIAAADDFGGMFVFGAVAITFALFSGTFAIRLFDFFLLLGIVIVTFGPFFFSSRRRQTRSLRDWSSDVCSSDLREAEGRRELAGLAAADDVPISHYRLAADIARVVTPETIVVGDGGDVVGCAAKYVPLHRAGQWLDPGPFGCLGVGPPFALAAKLLNPGRRVLLIAGDGAFGLHGMDMETAGRFGAPI